MAVKIEPSQFIFAATNCRFEVRPYTPCVAYTNDSDIDFIAPEKDYIVAIAANGTDKPMRKRGMVFPINGLESYVYKRSIIDRLFCRKGKPAIPPQSARAVILTKPLWRYRKIYYVVIG